MFERELIIGKLEEEVEQRGLNKKLQLKGGIDKGGLMTETENIISLFEESDGDDEKDYNMKKNGKKAI